MRTLLHDYVDVLIDTGARPIEELLNLQSRQIKFRKNRTLTHSGVIDSTDDQLEEITLPNLNRSVELMVSGKTGTRTIVAVNRTVKAFERNALLSRNIDDSIVNLFKQPTVPTNEDFVSCTQGKQAPKNCKKYFKNI